MGLDECKQKHTFRQYMTWMAWFDAQWDVPSRADNYAMQIAMEVRRVLHKTPVSVKMKHFVLRWVRGKKAGRAAGKADKAAATKASKRRWFSVVGIKGKADGSGD